MITQYYLIDKQDYRPGGSYNTIVVDSSWVCLWYKRKRGGIFNEN